jgi:hypothetical protein
MYDNKIRLSQDVLEKAELIAQEWGLKNARAAVEAVFRKYADEYLSRNTGRAIVERSLIESPLTVMPKPQPKNKPPACDALNELDELLGL